MVHTLLAPALLHHHLRSLIPLDIRSPVHVQNLALLLRHHPDQSLSHFLLHGFSFGFSLGVHGAVRCGLLPNLASSRSKAGEVTKAIATEVARGHSHGPFPFPPFANFHAAPLGIVSKKSVSFRLILDLSTNHAGSVNGGIDIADFTVTYCSFDDVVDLVRAAGVSPFMAKLDIKHAFRLCPVRPSEWPLLCFHWLNRYYFDSRLPFGLRSSPFIFNSLADALQWCCTFFLAISFLIHYLDDFFLCTSSAESCRRALSSIISLFKFLGIPLAEGKVEGPAPTIVFLGIEIDTPSWSIRLPPEKFHALMSSLSSWHDRSTCTKRELLSLIGHLSFAARVVKPGRLFLRRLISLSTSVSSLGHHLRLSSEAQADIRWWLDFLPSWNGRSFIPPPPVSNVELQLYTDASALGLGGTFGSHWFAVQLSVFSSLSWQPESFNITYWELFALVIAIFIWAPSLAEREVVLNTDNQALLAIWSNGSSVKPIMRLVRALFFRLARFNINLLLNHIPGSTNVNADLLSRFQVRRFLELNPDADTDNSPCPPDIWEI